MLLVLGLELKKSPLSRIPGENVGQQWLYTERLSLQSFHSRQGKAYLFNAVVNVLEGPKEERLMTTGRPAKTPNAKSDLVLVHSHLQK